MYLWPVLAKKFLLGDFQAQLSDLVGVHKLSGVDVTSERVLDEYSEYDNCNVISFILDGIIFSAIEDPQDGYRSSMRELIIGEYIVKNTFNPVFVQCAMREYSEYSNCCEILVISYKGDTILEAGTDNTDDYYPCFVGSWNPKPLGHI